MEKRTKGLIGGIIPVVVLWAYVKLIAVNQDPYGYGMAILPLIGISIILFWAGWHIGKRIK
jgi:hypothetical protein